MKPLKIVFMLALTVIGLSLAVYLVEGPTSQVIAERQAKEIEEALQTIFPDIDGLNDTLVTVNDADFGVSGVTSVIEISTNGNAKGYVYTVSFRGFSSEIIYLIGIDTAGTITGYQVLQQSDTPGYGAQIGDPANWVQFTGMSIETAGNGDFDGLSGASITTGAWKTSLNSLFNYHLATYGYTPKTDAQILQEKKESLVDSSLTVSPYTATNPFTNYGITNIDIANDGSTDQAVIYTVRFVGYNPSDYNEYLIAFDLNTNEVLGFITLYSGDTSTFGAEKMYNQDNWSQFNGETSGDLLAPSIDGFTGATATKNGLEQSLQKVSVFHQWEFEGIVVLTPQQQFEAYQEELFPTATRFDDVTEFKAASPVITAIYDAYDASNTFLGTVYHVTTIGASYSGVTFVEFLVGIDANSKYTGFRMVDDTETPGKADPFYVDGYGDSITGDTLDVALGLDAVTGSTVTYNKIATAIAEVAIYHVEKYFSRPDNVEVSEANLLAAYPGATTFVSVYENYTFNGTIGNLYEARDGGGAVLGYVYYGTASGNGGTIAFTWGVNAAGTTQQLHIISESETWSDANEYGDYSGSFGTNFKTSTWLSLFEGKTMTELLSSPVDTVAGVTNTTTGMTTALETIAQYHLDESVGGGE